MGVLIADTYTLSKINSHENAHISKIFSECFVYNTSCFIKQLLPHSLFKCQLYLGETNYRGFFKMYAQLA